MKKVLIILAVVLLFCFAGCHADGDIDGTSASEPGQGNVTTGEVHEYDGNGRIIKTTVYNDDGSIQYVETTDYTESGSCKIIEDANGIELRRDENYIDDYNGGYQHTHQITEDGVVTLLSITDTMDDGYSVIVGYSIEGTAKTRCVTAIDPEENDYYGFIEVIDGGMLTEYFCWRDYQEGEVRSRRITYCADTETYELVEEIVDVDTGKYVPKTTVIPAAEYVQADWEKFEQ